MDWDSLLCKERIRSYQKSTTSRDFRSEFEKDYHRIIGSSSFRRLQDKTQVFPLDKSDYVRTRLTHSLEVSSFAKSLAQTVANQMICNHIDDNFKTEYKQDILNILECAGLLHDIGNPPFGHFGETTIRDWFRKNLPVLMYKEKKISEFLTKEMVNDFYHFEGNAQAFRLVTKLHFLVDEHGMNLTKGLLSALIKYPVSSTEIDKKSGNIKDKKMGYFYADTEEFKSVYESTTGKKIRNPLTFLLEAADDIAYKTADIEDSVEKGKINYYELVDELHKRCITYQNKKGTEDNNSANEYARLVKILISKYKKAKEKKVQKPEMYAVQNWVISIQGSLILSAADSFIRHYKEIMNGTYPYDLFYDSQVKELMDDLGDIAYQYSFTSKSIYKLEIAASSILEFLLTKFTDAMIYYDTDMELTAVQEKLVSLISRDYMRIYKKQSEGKSEKEKLYLRLLLVTDHISSMTDGYAKDLYQELMGF